MNHEASPATEHGRTGPPLRRLAIAAVAVTPLIAVLLRVPTAQGLWTLAGGSVRGLVIVVCLLAAAVLPSVYVVHRLAERYGTAWWLLGVVPGLITSAVVVLVPERTHVEDVVRDMGIGPSAGAGNALLPTCLVTLSVVFVSAMYVFGVLRGERDLPRGGWRTLGIAHVVVWAVLTAVLAITVG